MEEGKIPGPDITQRQNEVVPQSTRSEEKISEKEHESAKMRKYCREYNQHWLSLRSSANSIGIWLSQIWRVLGRT